MDQYEQAFRDALRRADRVTVPVAPLDPSEVAGRAPASRRPGWQAGFAAAAALVVVAGVGVTAWLAAGRGGTPAVPAAPAPAAMVEVDLYSGRENPRVPVDERLADQVYDGLPDLVETGLELTDLPDPGLGFRGFLVTPTDDTRPVLRVLPGTVVVDPEGSPEVLADSDGSVFRALMGRLPDELAGQVSALLVQVRIRNAGQVGLTDVRVTFPDNQTVAFGALAPGEAGRYAPVGLAYRYALVLATADGEERRWQPIDFVGETPLEPGRYTYAISVDGDQIDLQFSADEPAGPSQEPTPRR